jgi:hypothetical protein
MGCCGVVRITDPETYLRLACERLLMGQNNGRPDNAESGVVGRACVAAGALDLVTALGVLDEYRFAMALRDQRWHHMRMHRRSTVPSERQQLTAQRVAVGIPKFQRDGQQWFLEKLLFADDGTHLDMSGTDPEDAMTNPRRRGGFVRRAQGSMPRHPYPQTIALKDDQGMTATAHSGSGSWGGDTWHTSYNTGVSLSSDTQWIEIDGTRIELPERRPALVAHVEEIEEINPIRAMLYGEILSVDRHHGGGLDVVEIACQAFVAIGALEEGDPLLPEIRRIAGAVASGAATPGLSEPWASLLARFSKVDGPLGSVAIGSVIDDLEGVSIRVDALTSEPESFSISLAMSPGDQLLRHFPGADRDPPLIVWWAEDDRNNAYIAFEDQVQGGDTLAEGQLTSLAPLDPKATVLRLLPTGSRRRGVITVPLADLTDVP